MRADPERIRQTARRIADLSDEFWADVESLRREAEGVLHSGWTGEAARTHTRLWAEWFDSAGQVVGALTGDAALLHQVAATYTGVDGSNAREISDANRVRL